MAWPNRKFAPQSGGDAVVEFPGYVHWTSVLGYGSVWGIPLPFWIAVVEVGGYMVSDKENLFPDLRSGILKAPSAEVDVRQERYLYVCELAFVYEVGLFKIFLPSTLYEINFCYQSEILSSAYLNAYSRRHALFHALFH